MIEEGVPLTSAQKERFVMLAEEATEVAQAALKVVRFGNRRWPQVWPAMQDPPETNIEKLEGEVKDLLAILRWMMYGGDLKMHDELHPALSLDAQARIARRIRYSFHQGSRD